MAAVCCALSSESIVMNVVRPGACWRQAAIVARAVCETERLAHECALRECAVDGNRVPRGINHYTNRDYTSEPSPTMPVESVATTESDKSDTTLSKRDTEEPSVAR